MLVSMKYTHTFWGAAVYVVDKSFGQCLHLGRLDVDDSTSWLEIVFVCVMDDSAAYFMKYVINFSELLVVCDDLVKRSTNIWSFIFRVIGRLGQVI